MASYSQQRDYTAVPLETFSLKHLSPNSAFGMQAGGNARQTSGAFFGAGASEDGSKPREGCMEADHYRGWKILGGVLAIGLLIAILGVVSANFVRNSSSSTSSSTASIDATVAPAKKTPSPTATPTPSVVVPSPSVSSPSPSLSPTPSSPVGSLDPSSCCVFTFPGAASIKDRINQFALESYQLYNILFTYATNDWNDLVTSFVMDLDTAYVNNTYIKTTLGNLRTDIKAAIAASTNTMEKNQLSLYIDQIDYYVNLSKLDTLNMQRGIYYWDYAWVSEPLQPFLDTHLLLTDPVTGLEYINRDDFGQKVVALFQTYNTLIDKYNASMVRTYNANKTQAAVNAREAYDLGVFPFGYKYVFEYNYSIICENFTSITAAPYKSGCLVAAATYKSKITQYADWYVNTYLPRAEVNRPDSKPGLWNVPDGPATYAVLQKFHLGSVPNNMFVYQTGQIDTNALLAQIDVLYPQVAGNPLHSRAEALAAMTDLDDSRFYICTDNPEVAIAEAARSVSKINIMMTDAFGFFPRAPNSIISLGIASTNWRNAYFNVTTKYWPSGGQYNLGVVGPCGPSKTNQAQYKANQKNFKPKPTLYLAYELFSLNSTAAHENMPGHGLAIPLFMEIECPIKDDLGAFNQNTKSVEGWALYVEEVMRELGLYYDALNMLGFISNRLLRTNRLRADTCLNVAVLDNNTRGCTLAEAEAMGVAAALAPTYSHSEMGRYLQMPAQALGYYLGAVELKQLQNWASSTLGYPVDFSDPNTADRRREFLRDFHNIATRFGGGDITTQITPLVQTWVKSRLYGKNSLTSADFGADLISQIYSTANPVTGYGINQTCAGL